MKIVLFILTAGLLLASLANAASEITEDFYELAHGENITLNLETFSRTTLRIYEGSKIHLNIGEDISLELLVQTIFNNGTALLTISEPENQPQRVLIRQENQTHVILPHPDVRFFLLEERALHYDPKPEERNIQLLIQIPLFTKRAPLPEIPDRNESTAATEEQTNNEPTTITNDPYFKYFLITIAILVIALFTIPRKKKRASKKKNDLF